MKGVILAGGKGTRLYPLTKVTNKHLLPVGREPMIYNPIKQMISAGIRDVLVVTSTENMGDIVNLLGSGAQFGIDLTYKVQEEPKGIAHALSLAETFAAEERIVVILGDNIATRANRRGSELRPSMRRRSSRFRRSPIIQRATTLSLATTCMTQTRLNSSGN